MARMHEEKELKLTFYTKDSLRCPVCDAQFNREELHSGGGRLNAAELTDELHRLYIPSAKFGEVSPLVYQPTVCPSCWFASLEPDFIHLPPKSRDQVMDDREKRIADVQLLFPMVDFGNPRDLAAGAAANYLALRCYGHYTKDSAPTLKMAICAIRAAWLFETLHKKAPNENWDWLSLLFKRKALFLYRETLDREQSGKEPIGGVRNFGPDTDKNYAWEGVLYMRALLEYKYGDRTDTADFHARLADSKRTIAKMFGLGKSSKSKPGPLLEKARELYDKLAVELQDTDD